MAKFGADKIWHQFQGKIWCKVPTLWRENRHTLQMSASECWLVFLDGFWMLLVVSWRRFRNWTTDHAPSTRQHNMCRRILLGIMGKPSHRTEWQPLAQTHGKIWYTFVVPNFARQKFSPIHTPLVLSQPRVDGPPPPPGGRLPSDGPPPPPGEPHYHCTRTFSGTEIAA